MTDYAYLKKEYPSIISADQLYKICHISKRKAKWLLENNIIPCRDSGKKTRRFSIALDDVIEYLRKKENSPNTVAPPYGLFSSTGSSPKIGRSVSIDPQTFSAYVNILWQNEPDALAVAQAQKLTGYSDQLVYRWISDGKLQAIMYLKSYMIAKSEVIRFLSTYEMHYYSKIHLAIIDSYQNMYGISSQ